MHEDTDHKMMTRCLQLAAMGAGMVAPNPLVGAVLVHAGRIIGEGFHERFGAAHAEVNCLSSVRSGDRPLIPHSTLYVSLEPCAHHGKTPPCADLIIREKIPVVVIGCRDPFTQVDGKGIEKLRQAGVEIVVGVMENECRMLNRRFLTFHTKHRPYVILKWAQSANGRIAADGSGRTFISNAYSSRRVHQWRREEAAVMVGTGTALADDPALTNRSGTGCQPLRVVTDRTRRLPASLKIFDQSTPTIILTQQTGALSENLEHIQIPSGRWDVPGFLQVLHERQVLSVLVEGGSSLIQSFQEARCFDELRIITNTRLQIEEGLQAPVPGAAYVYARENFLDDLIEYYFPA